MKPERRPIQVRDVFLVDTPDGARHYALAVRKRNCALVIATGTTKHHDEVAFAELDGPVLQDCGLSQRTRFLSRFVYAYRYDDAPAFIVGRLVASRFVLFIDEIDRLLVDHHRGRKLPSLPQGAILHLGDLRTLAEETALRISKMS